MDWQIIDEKQQCVSDNKLTRKLRGRRIRCMTVDSAGHLWIAISGEEGLLEVTPSLQYQQNTDRHKLEPSAIAFEQ